MSHEERPTQPVLMITGVVSLMSVYSPAPEARRSADLWITLYSSMNTGLGDCMKLVYNHTKEQSWLQTQKCIIYEVNQKKKKTTILENIFHSVSATEWCSWRTLLIFGHGYIAPILHSRGQRVSLVQWSRCHEEQVGQIMAPPKFICEIWWCECVWMRMCVWVCLCVCVGYVSVAYIYKYIYGCVGMNVCGECVWVSVSVSGV